MVQCHETKQIRLELDRWKDPFDQSDQILSRWKISTESSLSQWEDFSHRFLRRRSIVGPDGTLHPIHLIYQIFVTSKCIFLSPVLLRSRRRWSTTNWHLHRASKKRQKTTKTTSTIAQSSKRCHRKWRTNPYSFDRLIGQQMGSCVQFETTRTVLVAE